MTGPLKNAMEEEHVSLPDQDKRAEIAEKNRQISKQADTDNRIRHLQNTQRTLYYRATEGTDQNIKALRRDFKRCSREIISLKGTPYKPKEKASFGIYEK